VYRSTLLPTPLHRNGLLTVCRDLAGFPACSAPHSPLSLSRLSSPTPHQGLRLCSACVLCGVRIQLAARLSSCSARRSLSCAGYNQPLDGQPAHPAAFLYACALWIGTISLADASSANGTCARDAERDDADVASAVGALFQTRTGCVFFRFPTSHLLTLRTGARLPSSHIFSPIAHLSPLTRRCRLWPPSTTHLSFARPSVTSVGVEDRRPVLPPAGVADASVILAAQSRTHAARLDPIDDGPADPRALGRAPSSPRPRQTCSRRSWPGIRSTTRRGILRIPRDARASRGRSICAVHGARSS
jgi:hypothetical protein